MQDLIIVCEDSFGLDILYIINAINQRRTQNGHQEIYRVLGYIAPVNCNFDCKEFKYLGKTEDFYLYNARFALGIIDPRHKKQVVKYMKVRGASFISVRAPWTIAPPKMTFGEGSIVASRYVKENAQIGNYVTLYYSMLGAASVGDYSSIMAFANVTTARIGEGVYIAPNAAVMEHITVDSGACIYPNSIVVKSVKKDMHVMGVPARKVKEKLI